MISNEQIERFKNLDLQAIESIQDEKLRRQALKLKNKQSGFTLLELLVVVSILAIVAGTMLGALGGQEKRAASGAGANSIAAVESLLRGYQASGTVLNDLDALESVSAATTLPTAVPATAVDASILPVSVIGSKLSGDKLTVAALDQTYVNSLIAAGVTKVRVLATEAVDDDTATTCTPTVDGQALPCAQKMSEIDIPGRMFDNPRGGTNNRGRGFSLALPTTGGAVLPVWKSGSTCDATITSTSLESAIVGGYDNLKLGAKKCDVLVALGFGNNVIVGASNTPQINSAPAYGGMLGKQYNRYLALYNVGKGLHTTNRPTGAPSGSYLVAAASATLQAVVDTRGDFLDEELAEASGQKQ
jgi:prepilin-type N-terminal cleavage/methylation domain-containing protein